MVSVRPCCASNAERAGRNNAYTIVEIHSGTTGKLLATGSHTKHIASAWTHEKNVTFSENGETVVDSEK